MAVNTTSEPERSSSTWLLEARCWNTPKSSAIFMERQERMSRKKYPKGGTYCSTSIGKVRTSSVGRNSVETSSRFFVLPPSIADLEHRLRTRGLDSDEVIAGRMDKAEDEIGHWTESEYVLVNRDLEATAAQLRLIVAAERLKRVRQPGLVEFIRGLSNEFRDRQ